MIFADRFANGATLSGLNPSGGGPGFLLLIPVAAASFFFRSQWVRRLSAIAGTAQAAVAAVICGAGFVIVSKILVPTPLDLVIPLASGVAGCFFVPRVVISVLNETWSRADATAVSQSEA
jgi:hypothetical protein